jgi:hypothetical protein
MILGDVLATIAIVLFSALAAWAGGLLAALLFSERTEQASNDFEHRAWPMFFLGLVVAGVLSVVGIGLAAVQHPVTSYTAFVLFGLIALVAVFGSGGLFRLVARRVRKTGGADQDYAAIAKAGMLLIAAQLFPVLGTFILAPFLFFASFGAGLRALVMFRRRHSIESPPIAETP